MRRQQGNITIVMAALLVLAALLAAGAARLGVAAAGRAAAQAAADAVALAAAAEGSGVAERIAAANDAEILDLEHHDDEVTVTIMRGGHTARARARWEPLPADTGEAVGVGDTASRTLPIRGNEATR